MHISDFSFNENKIRIFETKILFRCVLGKIKFQKGIINIKVIININQMKTSRLNLKVQKLENVDHNVGTKMPKSVEGKSLVSAQMLRG